MAERTLLAGLRPVLAPARHRDPDEQVQFTDGRVFEIGNGHALVHRDNGNIYLAMQLRNVGSGMAVLRGYHLEAESAEQANRDPLGQARHRKGDAPPDATIFSEQQRDIYVPSGDLGFWQAATRDPQAQLHQDLAVAIRTRGRVTVDVLYTDHDGGQPTITRFVLLADDNEGWRCNVARHWTL